MRRAPPQARERQSTARTAGSGRARIHWTPTLPSGRPIRNNPRRRGVGSHEPGSRRAAKMRGSRAPDGVRGRWGERTVAPMEEWIRFGLLGLGLGALYSLASQGLVLVYRGSGVLNFAHGAIGMVGAYVTWELQVKQDAPFLVAFVIGVAVSAAIGAFTHLVIMKRLRQASPLARIAVTLGLLVTLQSLVVLRYSSDVIFPESALPVDRVTLWSDVSITVDRLILFGIAIATTVALWSMYRYSRFGLATSAVAENERAAASLGWSPDSIATANWALGSALSGVAAVLIS